MEFEFKGNAIVFNRELSDLDNLVIRFVRLLEKNSVDYVIISGYIAILFGRSRNTEDVDMFLQEMDFEEFNPWWNSLVKNGFECLNAFNADEAYHEFLKRGTALRFAEKGGVIPNFEVKFPLYPHNRYALQHKLVVMLNGNPINTSELEMQIAFKLKLGSVKDFEDARHLYNVFKEHLNHGLLARHVNELKVEKAAESILWKRKG